MLLALFAPQALATDVLREEHCEPSVNLCAGPGTCTPFACVPRSCQPAFHCRASTESSMDCAEDVAIEGETCQLALGFGVRTNAPVTELGASVVLTNGTVLSPTDPLNLRNAWVAPTVETSVTSGAANTGDIVIGIYTTDITTTGGQEHHWRHVGVVLYHGPSVVGSQDARAGVYLLDSLPEGCYARSSVVPTVTPACPRVSPATLPMPILP